MATGASISSIKAGLKAAYESINLPGGLGLPTVITRELDGLPSTFPYVEIYTNPSRAIRQSVGTGRYKVSRVFYARLYVALLPDDTPSVEDASYIMAENCIEAVEDYFLLNEYGFNVAFVTNHAVTADTAGVQFYTRANRNCVGVVFEHSIDYLRMR